MKNTIEVDTKLIPVEYLNKIEIVKHNKRFGIRIFICVKSGGILTGLRKGNKLGFFVPATASLKVRRC
jgi:hypothetical protein